MSVVYTFELTDSGAELCSCILSMCHDERLLAKLCKPFRIMQFERKQHNDAVG